MDEDVKSRFEGLDKRLETTEKRFDDIKWYFGGVTGFFTLWVGLLTLILSWNYKEERDSLREFQKELKQEIGKAEVLPDVEILGPKGKPLANQQLQISFETSKEGWLQLKLHHQLRNKGGSTTGPMTVKLYTKNPIRFAEVSSDESDFDFETIIGPQNLNPNEIPGGNFTTPWYLNINLPSSVATPPGNYPALLKVYYGKGKVTESRFTMVVIES